MAQIPQDKYNVQVDNADVRGMAAWINANSANINADNYTVPDTLGNGAFFLGGHSRILDTPVGVLTKPYHWDGVAATGPARINNTTTRHVFSLNTCTVILSGGGLTPRRRLRAGRDRRRDPLSAGRWRGPD